MYKIPIYASIVFSVIYFFNILRFFLGLTKKNNIIINDKSISLSIIVAVKNGGESVSRMLNNLLNQRYSGLLEFIIVDDCSIDNTKEIINNYVERDPRFKYVSSNIGASYLKYKKRALDAGIQAASYEHLLFTDIDCIIHQKWAYSIAKCFSNNIDYVVGHAYVLDRKSILNKFQRVDLLMLLFASKSMILLGMPWASIGQNQAYTKSLYNKLNGFKDIASCLQGDDTLFLQLAYRNGAKIIFNDDMDSYVVSRTELSLKSFILQRARWSGDANIMWKFNVSFYITALSLWVMSASIIGLLFTNYFNLIIAILSFKFIFELLLYQLGMKKFNEKIKYIDFIIWSTIHPFYVFIMGMLSFFNFKWR